MGLRDKLRKKTKETLRKGRAQRSTDRRTSGETREKVRRIRETLAAVQGGAEPRRDDDEARSQFARAEDSAHVGPVIDATLDPMGSAEELERAAGGGRPPGESRADDLVTGGSRQDTGRMEDLVMIGGVSPAEQRNAERAEAQGPTLDALVPGIGPGDADGQSGLIVWEDDDGR